MKGRTPAPAPRESILPTIKCSECHQEIEISHMGDHVCTPEPQAPKAKPAPIAPLNTSAANTPFLGHGDNSPTTGGSRNGGPRTPRDEALSPKARTPDRNAIDYNIDCPYPPFQSPKDAVDSPTVPGFHAPRADLYAPRSPTGNGSVLARMNTIAPGPFGVGGLKKKEEAPEILPSIAASFPERKSSRDTEVEPLPALAATFSPVGSDRDSQEWRKTRGTIRFGFEAWETFEPMPEVLPLPSPEIMAAERASQNTTPEAGEQKPAPERNPAEKKRPKDVVPPPRDPYLGDSPPPRSPYGHRMDLSSAAAAAGPSWTEPAAEHAQPTRANTFPERRPAPAGRLADAADAHGRQPPHPGVGIPAGPAATRHALKDSLSKALPPAPLPSPTVHERNRSADRLGSNIAPARTRSPSPVRPRSPPLHQRPSVRTGTPPRTNNYVKNASVHRSATHSLSSNASSVVSHFSKRSDTSSMTSPPTSEISLVPKLPGPRYVEHPQTLEEGNLVDGLMADLRGLGREPPKIELYGEELYGRNDRAQAQRASPERPAEDRPPPRIPSPAPAPVDLDAFPRAPSRGATRSAAQGPPRLAQERPPRSTPSPANQEQMPRPPPIPKTEGEAPLAHSRSQSKPGQTHKRTPTSKGFCRGCSEPIVGKSISSADGRLTGRYHKACFVCQTCREPFQSAEFYVLDNKPFCERHYHQFNGTLCRMCNRGIEGPCLETERRERFHPRCFCCVQCRVPLGDDYFEINGRPYCQRDAVRARPMPGSRLGPNAGRQMLNPNVERRRTRLMMMGPNVNGLESMGGMDGNGSLVGIGDMDMRMPKMPTPVGGGGRAF